MQDERFKPMMNGKKVQSLKFNVDMVAMKHWHNQAKPD
jgi:hypothetical protein